MSEQTGMWLDLFERDFFIEGGPYKDRPSVYKTFGVNVAAEVHAPSDVEVNVRDFAIPQGPIAQHYWVMAAASGLRAALRGEDVYVGCFGGVGRTGMMFATMAKICGSAEPIVHVRDEFHEHAVETPEQVRFISNLDVRPARRALARRRWFRRLSLGLIGW